jgi:uncharacterized Zn finger protein (UPF0148 family)
VCENCCIEEGGRYYCDSCEAEREWQENEREKKEAEQQAKLASARAEDHAWDAENEAEYAMPGAAVYNPYTIKLDS